MVGVLMAATVIDTRAGASGFSNTGVLTVSFSKVKHCCMILSGRAWFRVLRNPGTADSKGVVPGSTASGMPHIPGPN
jgi:hypothetical protein